jgi:hypothetical protein
MADNKTKPTKASVAAFLGDVKDPVRRVDARAVAALREAATGEKPKMWGPTIVGFGTCHYVYESGREGDMPLVGFSPRKPATVLYVSTAFPGSEALLAKLGKHTKGGVCIYVKKLADVDQKVLKELVVKAVAATRKRHKAPRA